MNHFAKIGFFVPRINFSVLAQAIAALVAEGQAKLPHDQTLLIKGGGAITGVQYYKTAGQVIQSAFMKEIGEPGDILASMFMADEALRKLCWERQKETDINKSLPTAISEVLSVRAGAIWAELGGESESTSDFFFAVSCGIAVIDEAVCYVLMKMLGLTVSAAYENVWIPSATNHLRGAVTPEG